MEFSIENTKLYEREFAVGQLVKFSALNDKYDIRFGTVKKVHSKFHFQ